MNNEPTSILAFRNGSIGNTLVAVPALRALRTTFPNARLSVVVDPLGFQLLEHCPWINQLIIYDKRGADHSVAAYYRLVRTLRSLQPSHAILFKRFFRNGLLAFLSGAPVRVGYRTDNSAPFLNRTIPFTLSKHMVDANLELAGLIGAKPAGRNLEVFLSNDDYNAAEHILDQHAIVPKSFIAAHYGGTTCKPDFMPIRRFTELLRNISNDAPVLLIGSGNSEAAWANEIAGSLPRAIVACNLPLRTTAALLKEAHFFVGFDTGPSHIAAAVGTPLLMLFKPNAAGTTQIRRWLPMCDSAQPLLPPIGNCDEEWERFFASAVQTANRFIPH